MENNIQVQKAADISSLAGHRFTLGTHRIQYR